MVNMKIRQCNLLTFSFAAWLFSQVFSWTTSTQAFPISAFQHIGPSPPSTSQSTKFKHLHVISARYNDDDPKEHDSESTNTQRRQFINQFLTKATTITTMATASTFTTPLTAYSAEDITTTADTTTANVANTNDNDNDNEIIQVYFGCGCFWHVQHEFVMAEQTLLKRSNTQITARAGYAGGLDGMKNDKVCYHNAGQISDYGSLGHAEVVNLSIPSQYFTQFAKEYCQLFDSKGNRPDQFGDKGLEYRNIVGLPGGVTSKYAQLLIKASMETGDKLDFAKGKGSDPDARGLAFIMDTNQFPFYVAEQYHQFHDGFNLGENYPGSYNGLAGLLNKEGTLGVSKCPNGLLGLGALGL